MCAPKGLSLSILSYFVVQYINIFLLDHHGDFASVKRIVYSLFFFPYIDCFLVMVLILLLISGLFKHTLFCFYNEETTTKPRSQDAVYIPLLKERNIDGFIGTCCFVMQTSCSCGRCLSVSYILLIFRSSLIIPRSLSSFGPLKALSQKSCIRVLLLIFFFIQFVYFEFHLPFL